nr:hypothetical protein [uncultured Acidocella sp.]
MTEKAILSYVQPVDEKDFVIIHQDRCCNPAASTVLRLGFAHERFEVAFAGDLEATNLSLTREWVDGFLAALSAKRVSHPAAELGPDNPIAVIRRQARAAQAASQGLPLQASPSPVVGLDAATVSEGGDRVKLSPPEQA